MNEMSRFPAGASRRYKIIGYGAAWVFALVATDPTLGLWSLVYMFPLGLARVVLPTGTDESGWTILGLCVGVYLVQAVLFFRSKNMGWTILWFAVLIILLIGNIAGCRSMIHAH
jgi:1,4-dihydroxy-2-naphthoate octaprenyltransferase